MLFGLLPFAINQCFSSTAGRGRDLLSHGGQPHCHLRQPDRQLPADLRQLRLSQNGGGWRGPGHCHCRWAEMGYLLLRTWRHRKQFPFLQGLFRDFRVPLSLVKQIAVTGTPLLLNETLWSIGTAAVNMCYSFRGLELWRPLTSTPRCGTCSPLSWRPWATPSVSSPASCWGPMTFRAPRTLCASCCFSACASTR